SELAQEAGRDAQCGDVVWGKLVRQALRNPHDGRLDEVVRQIGSVGRVVLAVTDLNHQAVRALEYQRYGQMARDQMGLDSIANDGQRGIERVLPDRLTPADEVVAAPDIVHEHVQSAVLGANAVDERCNVVRVIVVASYGDSHATGSDDALGGVLDR